MTGFGKRSTSSGARGEALSTPFGEEAALHQEAYNMLLLEKSAYLLKKGSAALKENAPSRKLTAQDLYRFFIKAAAQYDVQILSRDELVSLPFANAIKKKYNIDMQRYVGQTIYNALNELAENNFRKKRTNSLERRQNTKP
jgi:G:T/U-mismatch repair DNA glycosylase